MRQNTRERWLQLSTNATTPCTEDRQSFAYIQPHTTILHNLSVRSMLIIVFQNERVERKTACRKGEVDEREGGAKGRRTENVS